MKKILIVLTGIMMSIAALVFFYKALTSDLMQSIFYNPDWTLVEWMRELNDDR